MQHGPKSWFREAWPERPQVGLLLAGHAIAGVALGLLIGVVVGSPPIGAAIGLLVGYVIGCIWMAVAVLSNRSAAELRDCAAPYVKPASNIRLTDETPDEASARTDAQGTAFAGPEEQANEHPDLGDSTSETRR